MSPTLRAPLTRRGWAATLADMLGVGWPLEAQQGSLCQPGTGTTWAHGHRGPREVDHPEGTLQSQSATVGSAGGGHGLGFAYGWEVWSKDRASRGSGPRISSHVFSWSAFLKPGCASGDSAVWTRRGDLLLPVTCTSWVGWYTRDSRGSWTDLDPNCEGGRMDFDVPS